MHLFINQWIFYKTNSIRSTHLFEMSNICFIWSATCLKNKILIRSPFYQCNQSLKLHNPIDNNTHKKTGEWQTLVIVYKFYQASIEWKKKASIICHLTEKYLQFKISRDQGGRRNPLPPSEKGIIKKGRFSPTSMYRKQKKGNMKPNENCNPSCPAKGKLLRLNPCDYHSLNQTAVVIIRHWIVEWLQFWSC